MLPVIKTKLNVPFLQLYLVTEAKNKNHVTSWKFTSFFALVREKKKGILIFECILIKPSENAVTRHSLSWKQSQEQIFIKETSLVGGRTWLMCGTKALSPFDALVPLILTPFHSPVLQVRPRKGPVAAGGPHADAAHRRGCGGHQPAALRRGRFRRGQPAGFLRVLQPRQGRVEFHGLHEHRAIRSW